MSPHKNYGNSIGGAGVYRSISCAEYSEYELAIMHRQRLHLSWVDGNVIYDRIVEPADLETREGAEYLLALDEDGAPLRIRLDLIRRRRPAVSSE